MSRYFARHREKESNKIYKFKPIKSIKNVTAGNNIYRFDSYMQASPVETLKSIPNSSQTLQRNTYLKNIMLSPNTVFELVFVCFLFFLRRCYQVIFRNVLNVVFLNMWPYKLKILLKWRPLLYKSSSFWRLTGMFLSAFNTRSRRATCFHILGIVNVNDYVYMFTLATRIPLLDIHRTSENNIFLKWSTLSILPRISIFYLNFVFYFFFPSFSLNTFEEYIFFS